MRRGAANRDSSSSSSSSGSATRVGASALSQCSTSPTKKSINHKKLQTITEPTTTTTTSSSSTSSWWWNNHQSSYYTSSSSSSSSSTTNKLILTSVLSQFLPVPLLLLPFLHLVYGCLISLRNNVWHNGGSGGNENENDEVNNDVAGGGGGGGYNKKIRGGQKKTSPARARGGRSNNNNNNNNNNSIINSATSSSTTTATATIITTDEETNDDPEQQQQQQQQEYNDTISINDYDPSHHITVPPTPALTTLLDTALYQAYQSELVPTICTCSQLLQLYMELKESAALILRECKWNVGVPLSGGIMVTTVIEGGQFSEEVQMKEGSGGGGGGGATTIGYKKIAIPQVGGSQNVLLGGGVVVDELGNNLYYDGNLDGVVPMNDDGSSSISGSESGVGGSSLFRRGSSGSNTNTIAMDSINSSSTSGNISKEARLESLAAMEIAKWNEFDTIQDFAQQCYLSANEAIQRLSTDRLSDSANLTVHDGMAGGGSGSGGGGNSSSSGSVNQTVATPGDALNHHHDQSQAHPSMPSVPTAAAAAATVSGPSPSSSAAVAQSSSSSMLPPRTLADAGIGRCYEPLTRQDCWESPRLYCPDYTWADDAIGFCQRSLKVLSKHRFLTLVATNGWDRYTNMMPMSTAQQQQQKDGIAHIIPTPVYASRSPHPFPSLEAVHCLHYLVSELLQTSIPSSINKFRAATEANAVVSKRLYLVKCEYRAPMRALWESYTALNAAPRLELVETYLRDYHGVKPGEEQDSQQQQGGGGGGGGGRSSVLKKKLSSDASKKSALLQQQREKMEKLITEKYWKHPIFVEALQLERCCEKLEMDMSQMLLPLANLAREIIDEWKGRLRALSVVREDESGKKVLESYIDWYQLPGWRELLRRLKSILCRKPGHDESTGIRPFLLDLQGVPRHNKDAVDSSIEIALFPSDPSNPWFPLEDFVKDIQSLQKVLTIPGMPVLAEERLSGSKSDKATMLELVKKFNEVWDEEMFLAQYKDWYDLVQRQQELNAGTVNEDGEQQPSLSELAEAIRETEIELSIAMASKDQLDMVRKRLEDLRISKAKRHAVLASIVQDVGMRELDEMIVVSPPEDDATAEFPELSDLGLFGEQLTMSGEVLPLG